MSIEDDVKAPVVTGSPEQIWLVYGEGFLRDHTHAEMTRDGDVHWCEDQQFSADLRYIRADIHEAALAAAQAPAEVGRDAWISVDERLPECDVEVLAVYPAYDEEGGQPIQRILVLDEQFKRWYFAEDEDRAGDHMPYTPTHWQPLPAPPIATHRAKQGADGKGVR